MLESCSSNFIVFLFHLLLTWICLCSRVAQIAMRTSSMFSAFLVNQVYESLYLMFGSCNAINRTLTTSHFCVLLSHLLLAQFSRWWWKYLRCCSFIYSLKLEYLYFNSVVQCSLEWYTVNSRNQFSKQTFLVSLIYNSQLTIRKFLIRQYKSSRWKLIALTKNSPPFQTNVSSAYPINHS